MLEYLSYQTLFIILVILLVLSGLFSSSETAMLALNKYRLHHLAKSGHRAAKISQQLLNEPDKMLGFILLGNNFVNILAASIATTVSYRYFGEAGIAIASGTLTVVVLIVAEVAPKTFANMYPEKVAFTMCWILKPLITIFYPVVYIINKASNGLLTIFGIRHKSVVTEALSSDELKTIVDENNESLEEHHKSMLSSLLDFENISVKEVMVTRLEIEAIDLENDIEEIVEKLINSNYSLLPAYENKMDNICYLINVRKVLANSIGNKIDLDIIKNNSIAPYFIPEYTTLQVQVRKFKSEKTNFALVVDEHGDLQGIVTLNDIVKNIIGDFNHEVDTIIHNEDGSFVIDAGIPLVELNKFLDINFTTEGAATLNGLILETHSRIPPVKSHIKLQGHDIEILQASETSVELVKLSI